MKADFIAIYSDERPLMNIMNDVAMSLPANPPITVCDCTIGDELLAVENLSDSGRHRCSSAAAAVYKYLVSHVLVVTGR